MLPVLTMAVFFLQQDLIADVKDQVQTISYCDSFIAQHTRSALLIALRNQLTFFLKMRSNRISHVVMSAQP